MMVSFIRLLLVALAAMSASAWPIEESSLEMSTPLSKRQGLATGQGINNGWFYSWWSDKTGSHVYNNGAGGSYDVTWSGDGNFVGGKGYQTGAARTIRYSASFKPTNNGNAYLAVYGWTRSSLVEYYILENIGEYNPCSGKTVLGTVSSDGGVYDVCKNTRTNAPSIDGTATFDQYISVRQSKRSSGSVTTGNHFKKWESLGLKLGASFDYQIMAVEGNDSAGSANVTVS
ncbi:glycoside hydrolase family 11 protein [Dothistroma septosporum NZE10]|uniref:Endo-1,4-beta-xylanase n=1 Tax=Dothistroma septosporum (strain NZE10 / CBS 128990) TaxID=675120 RepID=N1PGQ5_DOTSN|nr:glycoside hydrolase family 11 protein [Dothistroma septosporum NZE10]